VAVAAAGVAVAAVGKAERSAAVAMGRAPINRHHGFIAPHEDAMIADLRIRREDSMNQIRKRADRALAAWMAIGILLLGALADRPALATSQEPQATFGTPEAAVEALLTALKNNDEEALLAIFGREHADKLLSKDKAAAQPSRQRLYEAAQEARTLRKDSDDRIVLVIGREAWPVPIPLVREGNAWRFNTDEGIEEILSRRIGENELNAIEVCRAYITAQWQYARTIRDTSAVRKFAQRLGSSPAKQDGLYWDAASDGEVSPFGPLVAEAAPYLKGRKPGDPYKGYYFKVLTRQGSNVPGGRYNYVINGNMIAGFAMVAYPAEYGNTGITTFVVSHHGKVYQKDLGAKTRTMAEAMKEYNPDKTWKEVED
jgi:hypothetical protein